MCPDKYNANIGMAISRNKLFSGEDRKRLGILQI